MQRVVRRQAVAFLATLGIVTGARVDDHGYVLGVFDVKTTLFCAIGVEGDTPLGWGDGVLHCGN